MRNFRLHRVSLAALVVAMVMAGQARAEEEDAVRVFRLVSPKVVSLQNAEGSGTGVIIRGDGLVITNAHVVSSPLPFTLTMDISTGDKSRSVTFKKVTIVGYHPSLDLALVKVDPKEHGVVLQSADVAKVKGAAGQRIFAIGNPAAGGRVLTKTITSGMLSAVDREVDGASYYQIDAAINPGNSGGPICDRFGKVLGIVTFRLEDMAAIGFAIPVHDLDVKKFLPLSERKSNNTKAKELLKLAEKYNDLGIQAGKRYGMDSEQRMTFNYYSCICYRQALMEDPGNPAVYYNVGMLLRTLDSDEVATAYLARSIQLGPWNTNGDGYRELGLALAKLKKDADALISWKEGIAKIPCAAKIWEDLAIYYINHDQPEEAYYHAAVGLAIPGKDARRDVLLALQREARMKMEGDGVPRSLARAQIATIATALGKMVEESNKARKNRSPYVTVAFAKLLETYGGPAFPGVETRIPQVPLELPASLAAAKASAVGTAPAAGDWIGKPPPATSTQASTKPVGGNREDWIGGVFKSEVVASDRALAGPPQQIGGAKFVPVQLQDVIAATFSGDGKHAFVLREGGVSKLTVPELREEKRCTLPAKCANIARSKLGLVVASPTTKELWLLSEELATVRRVPMSDSKRVSASPVLSTAYVPLANDRMAVVDLSSGKVSEVRVQDLNAPRSEHPAFSMCEVTGDGKYVVCLGMDALHRLAIRGNTLAYEASGPQIGQNPQCIAVSGDSRYVALPSGGGNTSIDGQPMTYATYVFKIEDLASPITKIASGHYPRSMAFDAKARLIYAQNYDTSLRVFSPQGTSQGDYKAKDFPGDSCRFVVHPEGRKLLVQAGAKLAWVELSE